ncbi:MAG: phosphonate C-P lyase system protein PhnL [Methylocystis sp.]|nr:phosphonate C-P lyase system protein PhnL [Methylocystis sp.]MCA3585030.1 phosphonate C-P lyase system protein PhnL [Methylocystis sp.]MCA3586960.1 phosphonate C-P lyase system protein PhnL [Methylocystis sp.]MCA3592248.1 phosphonate C-P lyase system protein PhnL [Methylocystis sp.]
MIPPAGPILAVRGLAKSFTLHLHGGAQLPVVTGVSFELFPGECVVLGGPSGAGKSSILKMIYGNYLAGAGEILIRHEGAPVNIAAADPQTILAVRRRTMGYVSQFLRVIPRVPTLDLIAEPALAVGLSRAEAMARATALLTLVNLPERLWHLPPSTFSGGEQQRVNIARGFAGNHNFLILDEPTASLDAANRDAVISLINARKADGAAFLGIFHDQDVRDRLADRIIDVSTFAPAAKKAA